jgi:hypothetical protein
MVFLDHWGRYCDLRLADEVPFNQQAYVASYSSIHMQFCLMEIGKVWAERDRRVVDKTLAKPWEFNRHPSRPATYTLEIHPSLLEEFQPGDQLSLVESLRGSKVGYSLDMNLMVTIHTRRGQNEVLALMVFVR